MTMYIGAAVDPQYLQYLSGLSINQANDRNMLCALCQVYGRTSKIMIPCRYECPSGWRREYYGYLMAGKHGDYLFYTAEAQCGHFIPLGDKDLTCVMCTK